MARRCQIENNGLRFAGEIDVGRSASHLVRDASLLYNLPQDNAHLVVLPIYLIQTAPKDVLERWEGEKGTSSPEPDKREGVIMTK